jgi:hypothetical protein
MTIKLTQEQLSALHRLFVDHVISEKPYNMEEKLIQFHLLKIYKKIRERIEARFTHKGYSINLKDEEAIAYYIYFNKRHFGTAYLYEQNFIQTHINDIDRAYA